MKDLFSIFLVLLILGLTTLFSKKLLNISSSEKSRKLIHVTLGITTLLFPYLFNSFIPVVFLGIIAFLSLFALRKVKTLRKKFGDGLFGVDRESFGEIYFTISIVLIFVLYKVMNLNTVFYLIPISILTFADSTAALIGVKYGTKKLSEITEDTKSLEGSFVFFVVAFMCTLIPLQLITTVGRAEVLIISAFVGFMSAMIEMTAHSGNDNFTLPFFTFLILQYNFEKNVDELIYVFGIVLFLIVICSIIYKLTKLSKLAIAGSLLYGYMTLILGSINWLYIPLLEFVFFSIFPKTTKEEKKNILDYRVIEANILVGMFFVFTKSVTGLIDICFVCFLVSYCMSLAMNTYTRLKIFKKFSEKKSELLSIIKTICVIEIPYIIFNGGNGVYRWWDWLIVLTSILLSTKIIKSLHKKYDYSIMNICAARANMVAISIVTGIIFIIYISLGGLGCITLS